MTITRTWSKKIVPLRWFDYQVGSSEEHYSSVGVTNQSQTRTMNSTEVLNYRAKIRRHLSAVSGRNISEHTYSGGFGVAEARFYQLSSGVPTERYSRISGQIFFPTSTPTLPAFNTSADNKARAKFYKRAKEAQTAFRGLTFLGELRETLSMIRNPARALRGGLSDYLRDVGRRSRRANRRSLNRIVAETWLEKVFGWDPLISDIKSAGAALNRRLNRFAGNYTRISATDSFEETVVNALDTGNFEFARYAFRINTFRTCSVRYYGQIRSVCENPIEADMTLFGTNWREIVPTAWELLPWSFLVDYFTNIGDILDAWSVRKSDIAWAGRSVRRIATRKIGEFYVSESYTPSVVAGFHSWINRYASASPYHNTNLQIDRSNVIPELPTIQLEIPGLGTKWINMSALLAARNRTRRQLFH